MQHNIVEMGRKVDNLLTAVSDLVKATNEDARNIRALVRIAESHERLDGLERR